MSYLQFFIWLTGIYSIYYLFNILWDLAKKKFPPENVEIHQLTFIDEHTAEKVVPVLEPEPLETIETIVEPVSKGLGGVTMKNIFELARLETISLTTAVSF